MNNETKLKQIIEKAYPENSEEIWNTLFPQNVFGADPLKIIFDHSFAKAYFKDSKWKNGHPKWKHHLKQLVLIESTEDKIDYLYKFI